MLYGLEMKKNNLESMFGLVRILCSQRAQEEGICKIMMLMYNLLKVLKQMKLNL